jgi:HSP20 family protein
MTNLPAFRKSRNDEIFAPMTSYFDSLMAELFSDWDNKSLFSKDAFKSRAYPKVDIMYEGRDLVMEASLPFIKKEDLKITLDNGVLTIQGTVNKEDHVDGRNFISRELTRTSFKRSFPIDSSLLDSWDFEAENAIQAELKDGLLTVRLKDLFPERPAEKPPGKEIPIR